MEVHPDVVSHPSWVCGLKLCKSGATVAEIQSHPSWVCGLKHCHPPKRSAALRVTPFVGVWIETNDTLGCILVGQVTPFVGVWIETTQSARLQHNKESHPSWVCGLKLYGNHQTYSNSSHTLRGCVD